VSTLGRISTVVLLCLVLAAPAAADELSLSASSIFPGEAVSYTVKVDESHPDIRPGVIAIVRLVSDPECKLENNKEQHVLEELPYSTSTTETHTMETSLYETLATYRVCEYYLVKEEGEPKASPQKLTSFEVVARPIPTPPPAPPVSVAAPAPVPVVTAPPLVAPATPVGKPVVKPMSKLAKALKQCKKLKSTASESLAKGRPREDTRSRLDLGDVSVT
jgi:hypothetical protein